MRRHVGAVLLTALMLVGPTPIAAQSDEQEAVAVIHAIFDAMRAKDSEALLSLVTDSATLVTTGYDENGAPRMQQVSLTDFAARIGTSTAYIDEQAWDARVEVNDNLATVHVKYVMFIDEAFSHCGVDAFHLFRSPEGWKVFHVADTQRREGCEMPPG